MVSKQFDKKKMTWIPARPLEKQLRSGDTQRRFPPKYVENTF